MSRRSYSERILSVLFLVATAGLLVLWTPNVANAACADCHTQSIENSKHPTGSGTPAACVTCHVGSTDSAGAGIDHTPPLVFDIAACAACHGGGDASYLTTGTIAAASADLTVADATGIDVGDKISVVGAGALGTDLVTTATGVNGTTITLGITASTSVTDAVVQVSVPVPGAPYMTDNYVNAIIDNWHLATASPPTALIASLENDSTNGMTVTLADNSNDDANGGAATALTIRVNWGDGTISSGFGTGTFTHTYKAAGTYPVLLTAMNAAGLSDMDSASATVAPTKHTISGTVTYVGKLADGTTDWTIETCLGSNELVNCRVRKGAMVYVKAANTGTTLWYARNVGVDDSAEAGYGPTKGLNSGKKFILGATRTNFTCTAYDDAAFNTPTVMPIVLSADTNVYFKCVKD